MKELLIELFNGLTLTRSQARESLREIMLTRVSAVQVASFLTVFQLRSPTLEEFEGFSEALMDEAVLVDLACFDPIDVCGTGGDGKDTFNISTLTAFVVAGAGISVAKHCNHGASSGCGSSTILECLGIALVSDVARLSQGLESAGICFLHAPLFHPVLAGLSEIRRALGFPTIFNLLGPLINPVRPRKQLTGVAHLGLSRLYQAVQQGRGVEFAIVYTADGYDEITLTGASRVTTNRGAENIIPPNLRLRWCDAHELRGGATIKDRARLFLAILSGEEIGPRRDVVIANAAIAIRCARPHLTLDEAVLEARESLASGSAMRVLNKARAVNSRVNTSVSPRWANE